MSTTCIKCDWMFDVDEAEWCDCAAAQRTLRCPMCQACFCSAPLPYKRRFWEKAPRRIRESPHRFVKQFEAPAVHVDRSPAGKRPTLLIVDDDEAMRSLVACFAEQLGYSTLTIGDPEEALRQASMFPFDVVITDALMPKLDGRELCRRLKAMPEGASKKVILMSSLYKSRRARLEAFQFGIDDFLPKPIDFNQLAELLAIRTTV